MKDQQTEVRDDWAAVQYAVDRHSSHPKLIDQKQMIDKNEQMILIIIIIAYLIEQDFARKGRDQFDFVESKDSTMMTSRAIVKIFHFDRVDE